MYHLCRWRPETHTFHLPCGEMTVTLEDVQKLLGLSVRGRPVTGQCSPEGWRDRVHAFLGRELPAAAPGTRTSGVPISWLRQNFGICPGDADEQTVTYYCRAWILHLFGCVLFPDGTGDAASWMYIPCLTDFYTAGGYSWASGVLSFLYRHLCEACRRTRQGNSVGGVCTFSSFGCGLVYLLVGPQFFLHVPGSWSPILDFNRRLLTFGTR